jgi:hypothetical protein
MEGSSIQPFFKLLDKLVRSEVSNMARPRWCKPGEGYMKCNIEAAVFNQFQSGVRGFILRDHRGQVIWCGCRHNRGIFNPLTAEVLALYYRNSPQFNF